VVECKVAGRSWRTSAAAVFTSILLTGTCLSPVAVAQTWTTGSFGTGSFGTASNWTPATVPNGSSAVAQFGASGTSIVNATDITVGSLQFNAGAPAYTIYFSGRNNNLNGGGIVGNTSTQTFVVLGNASLNFNGNGTTAGNSRIVVQDNGDARFSTGSTLGNATLVISAVGASFFFGGSLGTGVIQNSGLLSLDLGGDRHSQPDGSRATYIGSDANNAQLQVITPSSLASIQGTGVILLNAPLRWAAATPPRRSADSWSAHLR
jgi:hypothetical protein